MTLRALYEQAVGLHQRGKLAEAERLYLQVMDGAPGSFSARHMLGVLRTQQSRGNEALALIGAALALRPDAPAALLNQALWKIEDRIRDKERAAQFDGDFIALARSVYQSNDRRGALKRQINLALGSSLVEEKSYQPY